MKFSHPWCWLVFGDIDLRCCNSPTSGIELYSFLIRICTADSFPHPAFPRTWKLEPKPFLIGTHLTCFIHPWEFRKMSHSLHQVEAPRAHVLQLLVLLQRDLMVKRHQWLCLLLHTLRVYFTLSHSSIAFTFSSLPWAFHWKLPFLCSVFSGDLPAI